MKESKKLNNNNNDNKGIIGDDNKSDNKGNKNKSTINKDNNGYGEKNINNNDNGDSNNVNGKDYNNKNTKGYNNESKADWENNDEKEKPDFNKVTSKWIKRWKEEGLGIPKIDKDKPKFFIIWAYLTVSGFHHVGHIRGYSYADAIARYKRMNGFNVLLTAGGHASGNSALSKTLKIKQKDSVTIEYYKEMGLKDKDIEFISTPKNFVEFFSKRYIEDYEGYGFLGDYKRFTVTTNPDYNRFIQWQFRKLKERGLLTQKPYYASACPVCGPVAVDPSESDISKGGNAEKFEYTLIKMKLCDREDLLVVATLRPETMFGQTNVWINPDVVYLRVLVGKEVWIVSKECFNKLSFQKENIKEIGSVKGIELVGNFCKAPATDRDVIVLPSKFCDPDIGTGIVTSVPSDAPIDWIALYDLQRSKEECEKYNLDFDFINSIKPIPIISSKNYGDLPAIKICEKMGIKSQLDTQKLEDAKKEIYKTGFHTGVMLDSTGKYSGMKVEEAKELVKRELISKGEADIFYDLSEEVICRCGERVFVKKVDDQWFIRYSDETLKENTKEHIKSMNILPEQFKNNVSGIIDWFDDRACARQGNWLGTKLLFDESYTIEPISDSTLYPIYYLVSPYVNEGKIKIEQLTESFFDFVYLGKGNIEEISNDTKVPKELLEKVRSEVEYWYPLDLNLGGKEHQTVHFPVFLMNHVGLLPKELYPKGIFVNWWVTSKGGKISKSKGGAKSIQDEGKVYSVDAIRLFYANTASPFVDIVFEQEELEKYKNRLERIYGIVKEIIDMKENEISFVDGWLESVFNKRLINIKKNMDVCEFRAVSDDVYFNLFRDFSWCFKRNGKNKDLMLTLAKKWVLTMGLFTPFIAEELNEMLGEKGLVSSSLFPRSQKSKLNERLEAIEELVSSTNSDIQKVLELSKVGKAKRVTLFVSPEWKYEFFGELKKEFEQKKDIKELIKTFTSKYKENAQEIAKFIQRLVKSPVVPEVLNSLEDEYNGICDAKSFFENVYSSEVIVVKADDSDNPKAKGASPGKVAIFVE